MKYRYDRGDELQKYSGLPNKQDEKEVSKWTQFLKIIFPWITKKWDLGNAYLEAKVEKEQNEAEKIKAETMLLKIKAEKEMKDIVDLAMKEDEVSSESIKVKEQNTETNLDEEIEELKEKLRLMHLKYGTKISISIDDDVNKLLLQENEKLAPPPPPPIRQ